MEIFVLGRVEKSLGSGIFFGVGILFSGNLLETLELVGMSGIIMENNGYVMENNGYVTTLPDNRSQLGSILEKCPPLFLSYNIILLS